MSDTTPRFALPLLYVGQAQKEMFHNEALALVDSLLVPLIEAELDDPAALTPVPGQCWLIGDSPSGLWAGHAGQIAVWSEGGWRFIAPVEAMQLYDRDIQAYRHYLSAGWTNPPIAPVVTGGSVIDIEARIAIGQIITQMQQIGAYPL